MDEKITISYSPRRLAKAYYCGRSARHDRFSPGSPRNFGMDYGNRIDTAIKRLADNNGEEVYIDKSMEFYILNTPSLKTLVAANVETTKTFDLPGTNYTIVLSGFCDVLYEKRVVEVKTGEHKHWHLIQGLCYACITERPCQIIYPTREYSVFVEPKWENLYRIIRQSIVYEDTDYTQRNEHCKQCTLKGACEEWISESNMLRALISVKECVKETEDKADKKQLKIIYDQLFEIGKKVVKPGASYMIGGYTIRSTATEDGTTTKFFTITEKKDQT